MVTRSTFPLRNDVLFTPRFRCFEAALHTQNCLLTERTTTFSSTGYHNHSEQLQWCKNISQYHPSFVTESVLKAMNLSNCLVRTVRLYDCLQTLMAWSLRCFLRKSDMARVQATPVQHGTRRGELFGLTAAAENGATKCPFLPSWGCLCSA